MTKQARKKQEFAITGGLVVFSILFIVFLGAAAVGLFKAEESKYQVLTINPNIDSDYKKLRESAGTESIFTWDMAKSHVPPKLEVDQLIDPVTQKEKLDIGVGYLLELKKMRGSVLVDSKKIQLDPWKVLDETGRPERRDVVDKFKIQLAEALAWYKLYEPEQFTIVLAIDDTAGISDKYKDRIVTTVRDFKFNKETPLSDMVARGDVLNIMGTKISDLNFGTDIKKATISKASGIDLPVAMSKMIEDLTADREAKKGSSIYSSLGKFLVNVENKQNVQIIVFCDGIENNDELNFYKLDLSDRTKWAGIKDQIIGKIKTFPNLSKAKIDWYVPPQDSNTNSKQINNSLLFMEYFLQEEAKAVPKENLNFSYTY